jgi:hypothetical protein
VTVEQLRRQLVLLGEAQSAITQCCAILGEAATNRILVEISGKESEITDRLDAEMGQ